MKVVKVTIELKLIFGILKQKVNTSPRYHSIVYYTIFDRFHIFLILRSFRVPFGRINVISDLNLLVFLHHLCSKLFAGYCLEADDWRT